MSDIAQFLREQIDRARTLRLAHEASPERAAQRLWLRRWQAARLARTYRDLLQDANYRPAAEFFLSDLYGLKDTAARDAGLERVFPLMSKTLPDAALHGIGLAVELDALSEELDARLLEFLVNELGVREQLSEDAYAEAYRRCDNRAQREHQIGLIREVGEDLVQLVRKSMVYAMLRAMRGPAKAAGCGELQDFLERGFRAFRKMKDPQHFLDTVQTREMRILDRIYGATPQPFDLDRTRG
ncbi:MAG TPA: hypothetical protein VLX30_01855 [Burkholderiales bacterium]|nr:hypothetical protein [Burkholderiales bacterium]